MGASMKSCIYLGLECNIFVLSCMRQGYLSLISFFYLLNLVNCYCGHLQNMAGGENSLRPQKGLGQL